MKKCIKYLFLTIFPLSTLNAQPDLSGTVTFPDSIGIDLIRVEVWQNNQQITSTITDSLGYFKIDSIITGLNNSNSISPSSFEIYPNYPSPFDKTTNIIYEIDKPDEITITIYNSIRQKITTLTSGYKQKGFYVAQWNSRNDFENEVAQGIYFARLDNGKVARFIKLLKINGALNAFGISFSGGFYSSYKGTKINEDYLIKFIDINIVNRVDYTEVLINLPTVIHQVLTEQFTNNAPTTITWETGDTLEILNQWYRFGTALDTLINENPDWTTTNITDSSIQITPTNPDETNNIPIELLVRAIYGTEKNPTIPTTYNQGPGQTAAGKVTTPNLSALNGINIAAYDTLANLLKQTLSDEDGNYNTLDSLHQNIIDLIFNDPQNRVDAETTRVALPNWLNQILQETYQGYQGQQPQGEEGGEIGFKKTDFNYNNGLDTLILLNTGTWHYVRSTQDSIFYETNDPQANGDLLIQIIAQAVGGTQNQEDIIANLTDMVTLSGGIYDNDFYLKLVDGSTGPPIAGYVKESATGQKIYTTDGLFNIRIPGNLECDPKSTAHHRRGHS